MKDFLLSDIIYLKIQKWLYSKVPKNLLWNDSTEIVEVDFLFSQKSVLEKLYFDLTFTDFQRGLVENLASKVFQ